jgi:hypothetical protein
VEHGQKLKTVKVKITAQGRRKWAYQRIYDVSVEKVILAIGDFFHRLCGKRLVPMIRANLKALAAEFRIPTETQAKPAQISRSTIERRLGRKRKRHKTRRKGSTKPGHPSLRIKQRRATCFDKIKYYLEPII